MQLWTPEPIDTRVSVSTQTRLDTDEACAARSRQGSVKWRSHLTGAVCVRHYLIVPHNLNAGTFGRMKALVRKGDDTTTSERKPFAPRLSSDLESLFEIPQPPTPQGPLFDFVCWLA